MIKSLEFKVLAVITAILLLGAAAGGLIAAYMQKATLFNVTESAMKTISHLILKEIESTMLEGKADITRNLIKSLKEIRQVEEIAVYNSEGGNAFEEGSPPKESGILNELKAGREQIVKRDKFRITFYVALKNLPSCQGCHGAEKAILGAVKTSVTIAEQYKKAMGLIMLGGAAIVMASLSFSFLIWIMMRRLIISPVKSISTVMNKISEGDLSLDIKVRGDDEIGRLGKAVTESGRAVGSVIQRAQEMSDRIAKVAEEVEKESENVVRGAEVEGEAVTNISHSVTELSSTAAEIADSTEVLAASVAETSASVEEMVSSINNVNDNIHDLSTAVEATSSSIQELSATIKEVASNAEELATVSEETLSAVSEITSAIREVELNATESAKLSEKVTNDAATLGLASTEKTIEGMKNIKMSVERTADFIRKLGGRSDEIGKILTVIDEVTDQTTLLALNAAILAAQAGEHGKGFSVVAEEIKDLAERTAFSTQEISSLIQTVQFEVKSAVEAIQGGLTSVEEGFRLSREAGDALRKIVDSSKKSSAMALSIDRSTTEQAKAARLVADATERVRNMTGQIAQATAEESQSVLLIIESAEKMREASLQVRRATEEQAMSSRQISQAMELISERSRKISDSLTEHKIGTQHILNMVDGVKGVPVDNKKLAFRLVNTIRQLHRDSELLKTEMKRFRFSGERGDVLRLGVVPIEAPAEMYKRFVPLADYLSKKIGKTFEIKVGVDFEGAVMEVGRNITQICSMGPATYIEAQRRYGVKVLVKALRNGKPSQRAVIVTRNDSDVQSIEDLRGRTFAFGDIRSASGYIMPRSMLEEAGIGPEDLKFSNYFGHYDDVVRAVLKGDFDAGGVIEATAYKFKDRGLRLLKFSEEFPGFNICFNSAVAEKDVSAVRSALLSLNDATAEGAAILNAIDKDLTGFVPADDGDFDSVRSKMIKLKLL